MRGLALFSLDTLINLPRLYARAVEKACKGITREEILEMLADNRCPDTGFRLQGVIDNIFQMSRAPDFGRVPPTRITEKFVYESIEQHRETSAAYKAVMRLLHESAGVCVKSYAPRVIDVARSHGLTPGIFYPMEQKCVERIVRYSGLQIDVVAGTAGEKSREELIKKAQRLAKAGETWLMIHDFMDGSNYRGIAEKLKAHYIECNETSEAPLARVTAVLHDVAPK